MTRIEKEDNLPDRINIDRVIDFFDPSKVEGNIDDSISYLRKFKKEATKKGYSNIRISSYSSYDYYEVIAIGSNLENDAEYLYRLNVIRRAEIRRKKKLERERDDYERLKKKFENN